MVKARCFICNRKIRPKEALKRDNETFGRQVLLCSKECYEQDRILDNRCKDKSKDEVRRYVGAVNRYFPNIEVQHATCFDCRAYEEGSCIGFLADPLDCMEEKAGEPGANRGQEEAPEFKRW